MFAATRVCKSDKFLQLSRSFPKMNFIKAIGQGLTGSGLEKRQYQVLEKGEGYEQRQYVPAKWVSTKVESMSRESAVNTGFRRLFNYITAENEKGIKVDMTAPVATRVVPGAGPNCESTFTVSFYVPEKHQAEPPQPKNKDVFIEEFPAMTMYTTGFGGFANEQDWLNHARDLSGKIKDKDIHQEFYFTAGYDSPFKMFNRLNEV